MFDLFSDIFTYRDNCPDADRSAGEAPDRPRGARRRRHRRAAHPAACVLRPLPRRRRRPPDPGKARRGPPCRTACDRSDPGRTPGLCHGNDADLHLHVRRVAVNGKGRGAPPGDASGRPGPRRRLRGLPPEPGDAGPPNLPGAPLIRDLAELAGDRHPHVPLHLRPDGPRGEYRRCPETPSGLHNPGPRPAVLHDARRGDDRPFLRAGRADQRRDAAARLPGDDALRAAPGRSAGGTG